ncbi:MAG: selenide, water dikinase SelD [Sphaerochaetaceae bacterium]|nr:selenide, water dikinase SelD [Sphaerochaetaceae bacterium]MDC7236204.1 selenide, water dikinase SelD [Sphaerochaetaceae bacterium]MDC7250920.1 selenide, water dikinase SelD [Sphaerochaetaceae bacterium]
MKDVKLTSMVKTSGCAAKLPPKKLEEVLKTLPSYKSPQLLEDFSGNEDALAYDLGDNRIMVQSVDFFPPMVDDPYTFGQVAAANAISDIYAMGCTPSFALNLLCFPSCLEDEVMRQILKGGLDKAIEANCVIAGGHTISDQTPKYGLCVSGFGEKDRLWKNHGANIGDVLVLTKKIGVGIISTAIKADMVSEDLKQQAIDSMTELNKKAKEEAQKFDISCATDVTGFSLIGHSIEMVGQENYSIEINSKNVLMFEGVLELARLGILPGGMYNNRDFSDKKVTYAKDITTNMIDVLHDPQTSGGLLLALKEKDAIELVKNLENASIIGRVIEKQETPIVVI